MFIGRYYHTLEAKGRVSLPKKFRDQEKKWIVTRGLDGGLLVLKEADFTTQLRELEERTLTKKTHRDFVRLLANDAAAVEVDSNGRVQLPEYLITFAHLTKEVVLVGSYHYVEIWDRDTYHQYIEKLEPEAAAIAEGIDLAVSPSTTYV